jgi:hypothetical protein
MSRSNCVTFRSSTFEALLQSFLKNEEDEEDEDEDEEEDRKTKSKEKNSKANIPRAFERDKAFLDDSWANIWPKKKKKKKKKRKKKKGLAWHRASVAFLQFPFVAVRWEENMPKMSRGILPSRLSFDEKNVRLYFVFCISASCLENTNSLQEPDVD